MSILLLLLGAVLLIASIATFKSSRTTVGPARGMWGGTLGDLMEGKHRRSQTTVDGKKVLLGFVLLLAAAACFYFYSAVRQ